MAGRKTQRERIDELEARVLDLLRRTERLPDREAATGQVRQVRLAITKPNPATGLYPASPANVYWITLFDGSFPLVQGQQAITTRERSSAPTDLVCNLATGAEAYIPENSLIWCFRHNGQWWTNICCPQTSASSSSSVSSSASPSSASSEEPSSSIPSSEVSSAVSSSSSPSSESSLSSSSSSSACITGSFDLVSDLECCNGQLLVRVRPVTVYPNGTVCFGAETGPVCPSSSSGAP